MAKSRSLGKNVYKSKGQRPNVSRDVLNAIRRDRPVSIEDMSKSRKFRERVIGRPQNKVEEKLKKKYLLENEVELKAARLMSSFSDCGLTRAEAVQAAKTDRVSEVINKWKPRLSIWRREQKKQDKGWFSQLHKV